MKSGVSREETHYRPRWELHLLCGHRHTCCCHQDPHSAPETGCSASLDSRSTKVSVCPLPASLWLRCRTGAIQGDHRDWAASLLVSYKQVANFGVLNAFLLGKSKATSPLQITSQWSQKKEPKGLRHASKPAKGTPPAPQGSTLDWETVHETAVRIRGSDPLP